MKDPYQILGVSPTATQEEIKKAYVKLAKKLHPDLNPGDKHAEERFKEVAAANDLLSDPEKRRRFDAGEIDASGAERPHKFYRDYAQAGGSPYESQGGYADFAEGEDIFAELFRRQARAARRAPGQDLYFHLSIDFLDAVTGASKVVTLPHGGTLHVAIPPGIEEGQSLRLKGKGAPAPGEGPPGDAMVEVSIRPHRYFTREGDDIYLDLPVTPKEAALGAELRAPTPTGAVLLKIPKGSNTGSKLRLKGKGVQRPGAPGDEFVRLKVALPPKPDKALNEFLENWTPDYDPRKDMAP